MTTLSENTKVTFKVVALVATGVWLVASLYFEVKAKALILDRHEQVINSLARSQEELVKIQAETTALLKYHLKERR